MTTSVTRCARRWSASDRGWRTYWTEETSDGETSGTHKDGTTWVVDVGVVCPGMMRYVGEGAATVPGTAAAVYEGVKMHKYSDQPNFV